MEHQPKQKNKKRTNVDDYSDSNTNKKSTTNNRFNIDFFEFSFLVEACIPPRPISRAMFWHDVINKHYHVLTENERERLFCFITSSSSFNLENEDCRLFYARFDSKNQYEVQTEFEGKREIVKCFKWNDKFHLSKSTSVNEKYITNVKLL